GQHGGEHAVDAKEPGCVPPVEIDQIQAVVEQRPERAVGEALIIFRLVALAEVEHRETDVALGAGLHLRRTVAVRSRTTGPSQPEPARLLQRSTECNRQAACAGPLVYRRWYPVRYDDKPAHPSPHFFLCIAM